MRLLLVAALALRAPRAFAVGTAIANIDEFLNQCPSSDPIYTQLIADFQVRRNGIVVPPPPCTEPVSAMPVAEYTDALIAFQGFRTAYYMDHQQPGLLPWTSQTFYGWMKSRIGGINFKDGVVGGYCCDTFDGKLFFVTGPGDDFNRDFDRKWEGISGNIGFYAHEVRHADPGAPGHSSCCGIPYGCDDTYDESHLSSYGVQWWLESSWLTGVLNVGYACLSPSRVQAIATQHLQAANYTFRPRFCTNPPPLLSMPAHPGGPCETSSVIVPIVLSSSGRNGSFFTSELALTNRGTSDVSVKYTYTSAFGGASGTASESFAAGTQKIVPDAIEYLRGLGVPVGDSGNRGGTLRIDFSGDGAATVRTTTAVPDGRAGLAYSGMSWPKLPSTPVYLTGLRQNAFDRSNVAVVNAGGASDGPITLLLAVGSGDPAHPQSLFLPEITLSPGGFSQVSGVLASNGLSLTNGYVRVDRISGTAPFYAYGVINDQANSDGSFIEPVPVSPSSLIAGLTLPVIVETSDFNSELVVTNFRSSSRTLHCLYVASALTGGQVSFDIPLLYNEQQILPSIVQLLRDRGIIHDPPGAMFAGALFVTDATGDLRGVSVSARTSTPGVGERYGLYYSAVPAGSEATTTAWLYGLQQNAENRTNLALVNVGSADESENTFQIDLFDGATGRKAGTTNVTVPAKGFLQLNSVLSKYAPSVSDGYALVTRTSGNNPFIAYAVINDGGQPGQRSGDGAFVSANVPDGS